MNKKITYSVLPIEPTFFVRSIDVTIENQSPNINPVDTNFASLFVYDTPVSSSILKYLDQPIKGTINASIYSYSLEQPTGLIQKILSDTYTTIELTSAPAFVTNYEQYEGFVLDLLSQIVGKTIYLKSSYVTEILKNSTKYPIKGIVVTQYGFCTKTNPDIKDLFNYFIDTDVLVANTKALNPIEMFIQCDLLCSPLKGVTNTFGSQLWFFDFLFQMAKANVKTAFVDMATFNNIYTVMAFSYATRLNAQIYDGKISYGTLLQPNIPIYITKNINEYLISVVHKDITEENIQVNISLPVYSTAKLTRFLCNQTIIGEYGITFGELTFDGSSGIPINARSKYVSTEFGSSDVQPVKGKYTFVVDKMSIAIISIPITSAGAYFENINDSDEDNTIVTITPNPLEADSTPTTMSVSQFRPLNISNRH